jgi:hypothetical protein
MIASARPGSGLEKRKQKRAEMGLNGKLFIPQHGCENDCTIMDFSADGAGVKCVGSAPIGTKVVLYIECFGRFEGTVVRRDRIRLGVEFQSSKVKRERTQEQLSEFVANGMTVRAPVRTGTRASELPPLHYFIAADGRKIDCEIVDIALGGASLKTTERPHVGEVLAFGETAGRVVRHTDDGIAVQFVGRCAADCAG